MFGYVDIWERPTFFIKRIGRRVHVGSPLLTRPRGSDGVEGVQGLGGDAGGKGLQGTGRGGRELKDWRISH